MALLSAALVACVILGFMMSPCGEDTMLAFIRTSNNSGEATAWTGNILVEATRHTMKWRIVPISLTAASKAPNPTDPTHG
jgi:hypothetical protein